MSDLSELSDMVWINEAVFVLPTWTETRTETLLRLAGDGLSAGQIAVVIGVTRNAVIGKLRRVGEHLRTAQGKRPKPPSEPPAKPVAPKPAVPNKHIVVRPGRSGNGSAQVERVELPTINDLAPDTSPDAVSLMDIAFGRCRFPLNSTSNIYKFRFCGSDADGSYCARHGRIVYRRMVGRE